MAYYPSNYFNPYLYQQAPQAQAQQNTGIVWIGSEREAAMYPVAPNGAVTLWNQNEPVVYLKQADATGKPTLRAYDLVERPESSQDERKQEASKVVYATKEELLALSEALTKEIEKLKAKKPARKYEEDDE